MAENKTSRDILGTQKVTQIGLIVKDIEKSSRAYAEFFGMEQPEIIITDPLEKANTNYKGNSTTARAKLAFFNFDNITIELIEPVGEPSTWQDFLTTNGDGVHHIAFEVKDAGDKISQLEKKGMPLIQRGDYEGGCYNYIETTPQLGVLVELLENY
ncbi:VOC family protein [candidate division KSB1 bacterium]|nr:VOC family protein [candidate division KSB1 bacterium]